MPNQSTDSNLMSRIHQFLYIQKRKINLTRKLDDEAKDLREKASGREEDFSFLISLVQSYGSFSPSQVPSEILYLMNVIHSARPRVICEVGSFKGGSLFLLAQAAPKDALIISVDINYPSARKKAFKQFVKFGQRLVPLQGDTKNPETIQRIIKALRHQPIDFLFIDGDHSLAGVKNDYDRLSPLVKPGGIIAFHDIHPDRLTSTGVASQYYTGDVPYFWRNLVDTEQDYEEVVADPNQDGFGIGILRKKN
jgi:predicted O-methyltransferase YrrM